MTSRANSASREVSTGIGWGCMGRGSSSSCQAAKAAMHRVDLDALLLTGEANVRYFTGFDTQFWVSPTRPWFVIVPRAGELVAVIPEIGAQGMAATWVSDIRTWPSPRPDDDGVSLLAQALAESAGGRPRAIATRDTSPFLSR